MSNNVRLAILVAALGYFVDVYDLILFTVLRTDSLNDLGIAPADLLLVGGYLLNWQMAGFLIGGVLWGVIGDKIGRIELLFGSILLYSIGNILNGFVGQFGPGVDAIISPVDQYALLRFFTGVGLAGEIGGGITLVPNSFRKHAGLRHDDRGRNRRRGRGGRGLGVRILLLARRLHRRRRHGSGLLALRLSVAESGIFKALAEKEHIARGNFLMLFTSWDRFSRYINCILVGLPDLVLAWASSSRSRPKSHRQLGIAEKVVPAHPCSGSTAASRWAASPTGSSANGCEAANPQSASSCSALSQVARRRSSVCR